MSKVLIVNDCKFESIIMKDIINKLGHSVKTTNEYCALKEVKEFFPDIVIANLIMEHSTGDELIEKIKKIEPNIVAVLSSCNSLNLEGYVPKGVDEVIQTPLDINVLERVLKSKNYKQKEENIKIKFSFCPYCGKKLETAQFKFCPFCGDKL